MGRKMIKGKIESSLFLIRASFLSSRLFGQLGAPLHTLYVRPACGLCDVSVIFDIICPMSELISPNVFSSQLAITVDAISDRRRYIHEQIIPTMDKRRRRLQPATSDVVVEKLYGTDRRKPGEWVEFMMEVIKSGRRKTVDKALEIADLIYYMEQPGGWMWLYPNLPDSFDHTKAELRLIEGTLGVSLEEARLYCIVKYSTRTVYGDLPKRRYKRIESDVMTKFLSEE
jgi:hypothetical protein